ncbi:efflux RND transporter periplasmic adaptor subunit [uncultured Nonlabens sp.]|uniref:efflux RND transporter periplasmic adaptor subunit n=1 Tax=uncultured Nonlabens sp. TaxID=859306 RepID=UPI0030DCFFE8|tara:strand:+ start:1396 stop:2472 length:1077 start_codon:yes stop_codon:yes gene_type:complete
MKNIYIISSILIALLATSCGDKKASTVENLTEAIPVTVQAVTDNTNSSFLAVSGKVQAANSAQLSTRMMGYVNSVAANVGDQVNEGQLLISINNTDLQAQRAQINAGITEATVAFNNAQKDYNRFKNLFAENSASQKELDDMTANFNMGKARLESAKQMKNEINAQLAYTNITAPFSGVITSKNVKKGDMANPGQPLIYIEAPGNFEVMALVPESEISQIISGTKVNVMISSIDKTLAGSVKEVSTSAQQTGGQYLVKIALDKTEVPVLSGMFATVNFPVERKATNNSMLIPTSALVTNGQLSGVYTVSESNTALLRWLRLGRNVGDQVEVLSGLNVEESFILTANGKLFNGAKVSIQ